MIYDICPNCFNPVIGGICNCCGYDQNIAKQYNDVLQPTTILNARYLVGRVLGKGGFGITYLAKDLADNRIVAVKECMPEAYACRDATGLNVVEKVNNQSEFEYCKDNFVEEIRALYALNDNAFVVNVYNRFAENNTEYFVMEYIDGVSLKVITNSQNGRASYSTSSLVLFTVGSALMEVHKKGIIHRDISPENIMITRDGVIKLIDFGASRNYRDSDAMRNESIFLKPGFAPPEQYNVNGNQGPWTDIYALAATYYTIISGQPLVDSLFRLEEDNLQTLTQLECGVSPYISSVVAKALAPDYRYRYSTVAEFLNDMSEIIDNSTSVDNMTISIINSEKEHENKKGATEGLGGDLRIPYVQVLTGNSAGKQVRIPDYGFVSIGREYKGIDIILNDFTAISRNHCMVGYDRAHNRFIVIDKSVNGTYFSNGRRMMPNAHSVLQPNDSFIVCNNGISIKVFLA